MVLVFVENARTRSLQTLLTLLGIAVLLILFKLSAAMLVMLVAALAFRVAWSENGNRRVLLWGMLFWL